MAGTKRILIGALNWGLGHATRCIPLINSFIEQRADLVLAGDGESLELLRQEYPELPAVDLPGYDIKYPKDGNMVLSMAKQLPKVLSAIKKERAALEDIIDQYNIGGVISDNRYGLRNEAVPSVFMTHQLNIKVPSVASLAAPAVRTLNTDSISKFNECWVPDHAGEKNLSGDLAHGGKELDGLTYIGPLSRFRPMEVDMEYDLLIPLSGPEPQRSMFEEAVLEQLRDWPDKCLVVRGIPSGGQTREEGNITITDHLGAEALNKAFSASRVVVCRAGYSTVMDLAATGTSALLVPTPGQTEQEYLAEHLASKGMFATALQGNLDLKDQLKNVPENPGMGSDGSALTKAVKGFVEKVYGESVQIG